MFNRVVTSFLLFKNLESRDEFEAASSNEQTLEHITGSRSANNNQGNYDQLSLN